MSKILPKLLVSFKDNVEKIKVAGKDLFSVKLEPVSPVSRTSHRHRLAENGVVSVRSVLGGLHHDYQFAAIAA